MAGVLKRLGNKPWVQRVLGRLIALVVTVCVKTSRWEVVGMEHARPHLTRGNPAIVAIWHGRMMAMAPLWPGDHTPVVLASGHRDGRLLAAVMHGLGVETVAGSSSRGGGPALVALRKVLQEGRCVAITPDGPRGPARRAAPGIVALARATGAPIIPASFGVRGGKVLDSWDRFLLVWPFSRGVYVIGTPFAVPNDDTPTEDAARLVDERLNAVTAEADRLTGRHPTETMP